MNPTPSGLSDLQRVDGLRMVSDSPFLSFGRYVVEMCI
jgi:hypothetical protein